MNIVLDASAGIEIALGRSKAKAYSRLVADAEKVMSCDLYKAETANVFWKYLSAKLIAHDAAMKAFSFCSDIIDEFVDIAENAEESLSEALRLKHPVYDLLYITLARRNAAILLSSDKKMNELAKRCGVETGRGS